MKKIILLVILNIALLAQSDISVHELHKREFGNKNKSNNQREDKEQIPAVSIIPLRFDKSKTTGVTIFGYLPDWEYSGAQNYLRYDILTHIAAFDFTVNVNGYISNPSGWPWTTIINSAHQAGVKMILCVANFTGSEIHTIITTASVKQVFFSQLVSKLKQYQLDGINIDFEALNSSDRGTVINSFMTELSAYVKAQVPAAEISYAGPALTSSWDPKGLADACDYVFIMGYDFWGSWSSTTGASAPYPNITNVVNVQWGLVVNSSPKKMILGVPYYGAKWKARTNQPHSSVLSWVSSTRYRDDAVNSLKYDRLWATDHEVPWYRYAADTGYYQVWHDNDSSLGMKFAIAQSRNIRGVGMWALGYDNGRQEYWNELYKRFYAPAAIKNQPVPIGSSYLLINSYPNPFNASTKINYVVGKEGRVQIRLYDTYGRGVKTLVDEYLPEGEYTYNFNAENLATGVYFARIYSDHDSRSCKIILLK